MSLEKIEARDPATMARARRQKVLASWAAAAFGTDQQASVPQRAVRALEEDIEKYQAAMHLAGFDPALARRKAHELVDHMMDRPPGDLFQELGGSAVTLLLLAEAAGMDADGAEVTEMSRVLSKPLQHFAARNAEKNAAGFDMTGGAYPIQPPAPKPALPEATYEHAKDIVIREQKPSTSFIQRKLMIGYNLAASFIERMEAEGICTKPDRRGARTMLVAQP